MSPHLLPQIIQNHLKKNKLDHAYLFYGPGGKIKAALKLAQIILSCREKKLLYHPDFIMLEKEEQATQIKIERVRQVIKRVSLHSFGKRVVLIKNIELLSIDAANALLKTLEEPPTKTIFILTASNIKEVIPTIVSRCQGHYLAKKGEKNENCGREKKIIEYLRGDLVKRFNLAKEIAEIKGEGLLILAELERILRLEMLRTVDLSEKKRLAQEIKSTTSYRLLLKRNISARLILEDLGLRLKRRK